VRNDGVTGLGDFNPFPELAEIERIDEEDEVDWEYA
jgi:hypothetical protein